MVTALLERSAVAAQRVDHVIFGWLSQVAEQTMNIARNVVLEAGLPIEAPAQPSTFSVAVATGDPFGGGDGRRSAS